MWFWQGVTGNGMLAVMEYRCSATVAMRDSSDLVPDVGRAMLPHSISRNL